mgnify:CR=1 FL=1
MDDQEYLRLLERTFSADERKTMAANGMAMNDGSYPIASVADLSNAVQAYGRSPASRWCRRSPPGRQVPPVIIVPSRGRPAVLERFLARKAEKLAPPANYADAA